MNKKLAAIGGLAVVGTVAFLGTRKTAKADDSKPALPGESKPSKGAPPAATPELAARIVKALATADSAVIRALAADLRNEGFPDHAADLENAARILDSERAKAEQGGRASAGLPPFTNQIPVPRTRTPKRGPAPPTKAVPAPAPQPDPSPPSVILPPPKSVPVPEIPRLPDPPKITAPPKVTPIADPRHALAEQTAVMLRSATKGSEDKALVTAFQTQEGLKPSGFYGPGSGLAMLKYNIIPPKPFYFPTRGTAESKANYRRNLLFQAEKDPKRAAEWQAAAMV